MEVFSLRPLSPKALLPFIIAAPGIAVLFDTLDRIVFTAFPPPAEYWDLMKIYEWHGGFSALCILAGMVLVGPLSEEMLFRGLLQESLRTRFGRLRPAIAYTAFFFALIHALPWVFFQIFAFALILSGLTAVYQSVLPAVLLHAGNNLVQLILGNLAPDQLGWYEQNGYVRIWVIIIAGGLLYPAISALTTTFGKAAPALPGNADQ